MAYILTYDIGTTGVKACLFQFADGEEKEILLVDQSVVGYDLILLEGGGAEQDPDQWWEAIVEANRKIAGNHAEKLMAVEGISFCSQMQGLVLVDGAGRHLRPAMSYMDHRAGEIKERYAGKGPLMAGVSIPFLLTSIRETGVVAASVKDPVWRYLWVKHNEPDIFEKVHAWLDVKESIIARMTGRFVMSRDSAFATLLCDTDEKEPAFSGKLMKRLGIRPQHMPPIVLSSDAVGRILPEVAAELMLNPEATVFAGGGDFSLIGLGSGCCEVGDAHIYMGTSGWASVITDKRVLDVAASMATVVGVEPGKYNYFAELETAGKCLEWVKDHLVLDEINVYLDQTSIDQDVESQYANLYEYLSDVISTANPGSDGVLFAPWLHGNRCPFEDENARGLFIGIGLDTGKTELLRSVVEGVCYHMRWFLETIQKKVPSKEALRFVGGGALSPVTAQILADITMRPVETVSNPQNAGARGAAIVAAVGLGYLDSYADSARTISPERTFLPDPVHRKVHDRNYRAYRKLYRANREIFSILQESV